MIPAINLKRLHDGLASELNHAITSVIDKNEYISGVEVKKFERSFADLIASIIVYRANGTDALYIATKALNIKAGDEVIVPAMSWVSTSEV